MPSSDAAVNPGLLTEEAERRLHETLTELRGSVDDSVAAREYAQSLHALIGLRGAVDDFFERIMVMDENPERRANRLALLREAQRLLSAVADLSRLPG